MRAIDRTSYPSPNSSLRNGAAIGMIVLHSGEGTRGGDLATLCNNTVPLTKRVSAHYYVCRDGTIYQLVADDLAAWHAGVSSWRGLDSIAIQHQSIGIETEHKHPMDWPDAQCAALADLCRLLIVRYDIPATMIAAHRWIAPKRKSDPTDWSDASMHAWIATLSAPEPPAADPPLLGSASCTQAQAEAYLTAHGAGYTALDRHTITGAYWAVAQAAGLDPCLAVAQLIHETGALTSWWSQRPRRNPAGIGVTGGIDHGITSPGPGWARHGVHWEKGISFPSWAGDAVPVHVGRLLAYALRDQDASPPQTALIERALAVRPLPPTFRGVGATLSGLNGRWAFPGTDYAQRIAAIMNALQAVAS